MTNRPRALSLALAAGAMAAGLAIRLIPLGLPAAVVKQGGSLLWAMMIYAIVSSARPKWRPRRSAIAAIAVTSATELSQLYHAPLLDAVRQTSLGALLFGRVFSIGDLLTYAAAVLLSAAIDQALTTHATGRDRSISVQGLGKWRARNDSNVRPSDS